ncbi:hypothetical protein [Halosimplex pelagicum]|uniref:Uncharacterized protein n=1 Tax=Halosimplex pelagicum TaxID=869886 RepID=A0A7D5P9T9_9EURY|nr:hypothetical protein [Halosimplex pelagicum]QLH80982.1 hypothetical protein HZS54_04730 [Halosimplex pelagicum]
MLDTETYTLDTAIDDLDERIDDYDEAIEATDEETDEYQMLQDRRDTLSYRRNGLIWQRDEAGWGGDAVIKIGAPAAGEEALMDREVPEAAGEKERRLWYVATATVEAPHDTDSISDAFDDVANCHSGYIRWAEAQANGLGVAGNATTSSTSSTATEDSATSTDEPASTTSSSSGSPTE